MTQRLPRRIGLTAAKRLMFTAKEIGAGEAKDLGLVDVLVETGGFGGVVEFDPDDPAVTVALVIVLDPAQPGHGRVHGDAGLRG